MIEHGTRSRYVDGTRNWQPLESAQTLITGLIVRGEDYDCPTNRVKV